EALGAVQCSAKTGLGIKDVLETIVRKIPAPDGDVDLPTQALIIDSWFDAYQGVVSLVRIKHGSIKTKDKIKIMSTGQVYEVDEVGIFSPKATNTGQLHPGEVGYIIAGIKEIKGAPVGDTLTLSRNSAEKPLPGFKRIKPQ